jgi:hypothetical protein
MDRADASARVAEILRANPDGISRAGLMAWARLRIAADLSEEQLDAALAALGPAVTTEGGFVRLVAPGTAYGPTRATSTGIPADEAAERLPDSTVEAEPARSTAFSTVALLEPAPATPSATPTPSTWVAGSRPTRWARAVMVAAALVAVGAMALLGVAGQDGSGAGSTTVPSDPRGSIVPADQLAVGSCFVVPTATTFDEVEIRPCDAPHDGEVVSVFDFASAGSGYPTETELESGVGPTCQADFESYTGLRWEDRSALTYSWFYPSEDAWQGGSRTIQCFLAPTEGSLATSYRAAP